MRNVRHDAGDSPLHLVEISGVVNRIGITQSCYDQYHPYFPGKSCKAGAATHSAAVMPHSRADFYWSSSPLGDPRVTVKPQKWWIYGLPPYEAAQRLNRRLSPEVR
jgi:hypothetical protein